MAIAEHLGVPIYDAEAAIQRLYGKLGVHGRVEAVLAGILSQRL